MTELSDVENEMEPHPGVMDVRHLPPGSDCDESIDAGRTVEGHLAEPSEKGTSMMSIDQLPDDLLQRSLTTCRFCGFGFKDVSLLLVVHLLLSRLRWSLLVSSR